MTRIPMVDDREGSPVYMQQLLTSGDCTVESARHGAEVQKTATTAASQAPPQKGRRILVVEDNPTNRELIRQQMHLFAREAAFAEDGQRALELWRSGDFALVLTDLRMPRMDGYALAAAIRAEEQAKDAKRTPIVALSANALYGEELRCRTAGMDAFLSKPVPLPRLQAAIEEWLPAIAEIAERAVNSHSATVAPTAALPGFSLDVPVAARLAVLPPVDLTVLKALVGDDEAVIAEVLRAFQENTKEFSQC